MYLRSENKGPNLSLYFCICKNRFSHDTANMVKFMKDMLNLSLVVRKPVFRVSDQV